MIILLASLFRHQKTEVIFTQVLREESQIERTSIKGISPHHAGLTTLEQHIVEKWLRNSIVSTVIATPTLAQGVDLPFDISILSFTSRYDGQQYVPLSSSEVRNMLGRAGRAGLVSDGVCFISAISENRGARQVLDNTRRYYFHAQEQMKDFLGLSRLMAKATNVNVIEEDWLFELGGVDFSESQTLVSFSLDATEGTDDFNAALAERLRLYPSVHDLQETIGEELDVIDVLVSHLAPLVSNVHKLTDDNPILLRAMQLTGMPFQVLEDLVEELKGVRFARSTRNTKSENDMG